MNLKSLSLPASILLSFSVLASENKESLLSFLPEDTLLAMEIDNWEDIQDDLESGQIKFVGNSDQRIKEDFLRIIRYLRFFLSYSSNQHDPEVIRIIKKNLKGLSSLSKERLLDELKKYVSSKLLTKLSNDKISLELFEMIFPQLKKIKYFYKPNIFAQKKID